jgi:hypothetical protein
MSPTRKDIEEAKVVSINENLESFGLIIIQETKKHDEKFSIPIKDYPSELEAYYWDEEIGCILLEYPLQYKNIRDYACEFEKKCVSSSKDKIQRGRRKIWKF